MKVIEITDHIDDDYKIMMIEAIIANKQQFLLECHSKIKSSSKNNEFLEKVRSDYEKYYYYISQQKIDQIKALGIINKYIDNIKLELSELNKADALEEQNKILAEINKIRYTLNGIISDTKTLQSQLEIN
jgi:hypothetical protein